MSSSDQRIRDSIDGVVRQSKTSVLGVAERLLEELRHVCICKVIVDMGGFAARLDHRGTSQHSEMPTDSALRLLQGLNQRGNTALSRDQQQDKLNPDWFGKRLEDLAHLLKIICLGNLRNSMLVHIVNLSSVLADKQK